MIRTIAQRPNTWPAMAARETWSSATRPRPLPGAQPQGAAAEGAAAEGAPAPCQIVADANEGEIVDLLNGWSARHSRLWYLAYMPQDNVPVASPIVAAALRRQLETHAARLDHVDLGYVTATLYILPDEPRFVMAEGESVHARFGGQLAVTGGVLLEQPVAADGAIRLRLRWEASVCSASRLCALCPSARRGRPYAQGGPWRRAAGRPALLADLAVGCRGKRRARLYPGPPGRAAPGPTIGSPPAWRMPRPGSGFRPWTNRAGSPERPLRCLPSTCSRQRNRPPPRRCTWRSKQT